MPLLLLKGQREDTMGTWKPLAVHSSTINSHQKVRCGCKVSSEMCGQLCSRQTQQSLAMHSCLFCPSLEFGLLQNSSFGRTGWAKVCQGGLPGRCVFAQQTPSHAQHDEPADLSRTYLKAGTDPQDTPSRSGWLHSCVGWQGAMVTTAVLWLSCLSLKHLMQTEQNVKL